MELKELRKLSRPLFFFLTDLSHPEYPNVKMSPSKVKFSSDKDNANRQEDEEECCGIFLLKNLLFIFNFILLVSSSVLKSCPKTVRDTFKKIT